MILLSAAVSGVFAFGTFLVQYNSSTYYFTIDLSLFLVLLLVLSDGAAR